MRLRSMPLGGTAKVNSSIAESTERVSKDSGTKEPRLSERKGGITTDRIVVMIPMTPVTIEK